ARPAPPGCAPRPRPERARGLRVDLDARGPRRGLRSGADAARLRVRPGPRTRPRCALAGTAPPGPRRRRRGDARLGGAHHGVHDPVLTGIWAPVAPCRKGRTSEEAIA